MLNRLTGLVGLGVLVAIAYGLSNNRRTIPWRTVAWGLALQFGLAIFILRFPPGYQIFQQIGNGARWFLNFSDAGSEFLFGPQFRDFFFAFKILPTIIFFSAFISILYHYGILQRLIQAIAWIMIRTMKTSALETLPAAANIFVSQTEAPVLIRPYLPKLTQSELHAVMTCGFATSAGSLIGAYISLGIPAEHLIAAAVMSTPAGLVMSKLLYPGDPVKADESATLNLPGDTINIIDAITQGALNGLRLALNIGALVIAMLGLLAFVNAIVAQIGIWFGLADLSLQVLAAYPLAPLAWLMGVPWADCLAVGKLIGEKTILNEIIAYASLQKLMAEQALSDRSVVIATYALCGFANFGAIGMQIGGIGGLAPERQTDLARLGGRAMLGGALASFMTAAIAGILL